MCLGCRGEIPFRNRSVHHGMGMGIRKIWKDVRRMKGPAPRWMSEATKSWQGRGILHALCRENSLWKWEFTENSDVHVIDTGTQFLRVCMKQRDAVWLQILSTKRRAMRVHQSSGWISPQSLDRHNMSFHGRHHGFVSLFHVFVWDTKAGQVDGMEECQLALWCLSAEVFGDHGFSELKPVEALWVREELGKSWFPEFPACCFSLKPMRQCVCVCVYLR